jgi:nicotinate-nucleotide--dimethylbenzimidazole phosphoribosyltransferase
MPPGSLGRLLSLGQQLAGLQRTDQPVGTPALIAVMAADHGVSAAGVSAYPCEVTGQMVANFLAGGAAINVLARRAGAELFVVDLGVAHLPPEVQADPSLISKPIRAGTSNLLEGAAMSREEMFRAVQVGLSLAEQWVGQEQSRVVALGDMGIGNTTTAAALAAVLCGQPAEAVVGRGSGVGDHGLAHKRDVVARAIAHHTEGATDLLGWLERLGGFEILGLAGLAIGAARHRAMVVVDGFISSVAALIAARLCPLCREAMVAAHLGPEPGHRIVLDALRLDPLLHLGLRLGEGSGAALVLPMIASAADIMRKMATFDSAGVSGPTGLPAAES